MKKIIIGLSVFVVLLIGAALVAPGFIDWSKYRAQISKQVQATIGRELIIGGDIQFAILPSPVLSVSDIRLSNAPTGLNPDIVHMRQLDVQVALFPLLTGAVTIQSIRLIEPEIHLEILTNGQGNWVFDQANAQNDPPASDEAALGPQNNNGQNDALPLQIDQFIIEGAHLHFTNHTNGQQEHIQDLNARFSLAGLSGPFEAAGTLLYKDIPLGFEANMGQIVNNRSASFAGLLKTAHGPSETRFSGTFTQETDGPRVSAKITSQTDSLAGLLSSVVPDEQLNTALDRVFSLETVFNYQNNKISFGEQGLTLNLGEDHLTILGDATLGDAPTFNIETRLKTLNADTWLTATPYRAPALEPLPLVIERTTSTATTSGNKVSTSLSGVSETDPSTQSPSTGSGPAAFEIPPELSGQLTSQIDALLLKGESIRQIQTNLSVQDGTLALERLSAVLPGAGDLSVFGVAGPTEDGFGFDGSLDLNFALLRNALSWLDVDVSQIPKDRLQQLSLNAALSGGLDRFEITSLTGQMDATQISGTAGLGLGSLGLGDLPQVSLNLILDRLNVDTYLSAPPVPFPPAAPPSNEAAKPDAGAPVVPDLSFLGALNADLSLRINELHLKGQDINGLRLASQIQNGAVRFDGSAVQNLAGLNLQLGGGVSPNAGSLNFENLTLSLKGNSIAQALNLVELQDTVDARALGPVDLNTQVNGPLLKPSLDVALSVQNAQLAANGTADLFPLPTYQGTVSLNSPQFQRLVRAFVPDFQSAGRINLNTDLDVVASAQSVQVTRLNGSLNTTPLSGNITAHLASPLKVEARLQTGQLDLNPLLPASRDADAPNRSAPASQAKNTARWSSDPLDLSALQGVEAAIDLKAQALRFQDIVAQNLSARLRLKDGILDYDQTIADLFGGAVETKTRLISTEQLRATTDVKTGTLNVQTALQQLTGSAAAGGQMQLSTSLNTQGVSQLDLVRNLNGELTSNLSRISVKKAQNNPAFQLFGLLSTLSGRNPSSGLADVTLNSSVQNGVARLTTASLASAVANGSAQGVIDLTNWQIDVDGTLKVAQTALAGLIAQQTKMKTDYPFSFKGSLDSPAIKLDTGGIDSGGGLIVPIPEKLDRNGVGNLLRGVLGGAGVQTAPKEPDPAPVPAVRNDGTVAPPPPPPGTNRQAPPPSVEQQLLEGLGGFLRNR